MSNIEKIEELLRSDEAVQAKLKAAADAYEGDRTDEKAFFDATFGKVGEELGFPVSFEEAAAHAKKMVNLNDSEVDAVAGGGDFCYIVGGTSEGGDHGDCLGTKDWATGFGACVYVGSGLFTW